MDRRQFNRMWLAAIGGSFLTSGSFIWFHKGTPGISFAGKLATLRGTAKAKRVNYRKISPLNLWDTFGLIANKNNVPGPKTVHWPNPLLFTLRYSVAERNREFVTIDNVVDELLSSSGKYALQKQQSGTVLENFALSRITFRDEREQGGSFEFEHLDKALQIIDFALSLKENSRDLRLRTLQARLLALTSENSHIDNYQRVESNGLEGLPFFGLKSFIYWSERTADRLYGKFRWSLWKRILCANEAMNYGASSSGKDTGDPERDGSNPACTTSSCFEREQAFDKSSGSSADMCFEGNNSA